jgi:hypothetical protein
MLDLEGLPGLFTSPDLRVVEEEGAYYLESVGFDVLDEGGAVHEEAQCLLPLINGAARLRSRSYRNVAIGYHVVEFGVDGSVKHHQVVVADTLTIRTKVNAVLVKVGEEEPQPPAPGSQDTDKWLDLAANDRDVAEVLTMWGGKPHDWFHLYKVFEIVKSRTDIKGSGWATAIEIRRFTWTANHPGAAGADARHARRTTNPPARPMTLAEGDALIERILMDWFQSLITP